MKRTEGYTDEEVEVKGIVAKKRIRAILNASKDMTTEQAVLAIEFGKVLLTAGKFPDSMSAYYELLTKLEAEATEKALDKKGMTVKQIDTFFTKHKEADHER